MPNLEKPKTDLRVFSTGKLSQIFTYLIENLQENEHIQITIDQEIFHIHIQKFPGHGIVQGHTSFVIRQISGCVTVNIFLIEIDKLLEGIRKGAVATTN